VWNLLHVTLCASGILRWLLDDKESCTPLIWCLSSRFNDDSSYALFSFYSVTLLTFSVIIIIYLSYTIFFYIAKSYAHNDLPLGH